MNRFAVTSHGSLVVISISIFMTKQGMRVGKLRSKLNRPNEELYGALVVMTQWKTIPNSTPRLQKFYTELHINAHISIHLSSDTDASTKTTEVQHNLTLFVVLVWKLGRKIIFSHMGRGATRLDGAWGKKQAWRLLVGNWGLAEANVLYWRKYLWHCLDFSAPPWWFGAWGIVPPFPPSLRPCTRSTFYPTNWHFPRSPPLHTKLRFDARGILRYAYLKVQ